MIHGNNNIIKFEFPISFSNITIHFQNVDNCTVDIKSTIHYITQLYIHMGESSNMKFLINKNVSICSASILSNQQYSEVEIGADCMIASNVKIVGADGHTICDKETGKIMNIQKNKCSIGNHVWLGDECRIMKNAVISDGSVVGANSVVSGNFFEKNVILAGNPAKIVKKNIEWKRDVLTDIGE